MTDKTWTAKNHTLHPIAFDYLEIKFKAEIRRIAV
jgi:hypothetical protein